ncbi:CoA transferase [Nocardioides sp.]|uniref:CoA transferase n=1 Tax=Nocardioides sp. TaxID=35761 RepID=UPI003D0C9091
MSLPGRLRVVEIAGGVAGAACGRLFAGLGHEVVRLEPAGGDPLSRQGPLNEAGMSLAFVALQADKQRHDLTGSQQDVEALLDGADVVVVDNSLGGVGIDLDLEGLRRGRRELVVVWISGFGLGEAYGDLPCDSFLAESYGGLATMIGDPSARPLSLGGEQTAHCSGIAGFLGAMVSLGRVDQGHGGDVVDVSMSDVAAYMDWKSDVGYAQTGVAPRRSGPEPGDWRLVRARDGWVGCIFQQEHWENVVALVGAPELADPDLSDPFVRAARADDWWPVIERWASELAAKEIYDAAQQLGLPFGWVCRTSDLVADEQLRSRGFLADPTSFTGDTPAVHGPVRAADLTWQSGVVGDLRPLTRPPARDIGRTRRGSGSAVSSSGATPLADVVVLDFGTITAGAAVTRLLADYGATVIKVESPTRPDSFRRWKTPVASFDSSMPGPTSPFFASNNAGKLSLALDLKTDEGKRVIHELARRCHVVVENYRVGVTGRLGIDASTLGSINPELVYLSLSSQGQTGPDSAHSSYGSTLDLLSGLTGVTGYGPEQPRWSSSDVNYPDQLVAFFGAALVAYCLQFRKGAYLDVSQREVVSWTLAGDVADFMLNGEVSQPRGNDRPGRTPHDAYPCSDEDTWIAIACWSDDQRHSLARLIGARSLVDRDEAWWRANSAEVDAQISGWTSARARDDAVAALRVAGVPAVPVLDAADRATMARFLERGVSTFDARGPLKGTPLRLLGYEPARSSEAPELGQHTRTILREFGGMSEEAIDRLEAMDVVMSSAPCPDREEAR